jgi:hypothetical protein
MKGATALSVLPSRSRHPAEFLMFCPRRILCAPFIAFFAMSGRGRIRAFPFKPQRARFEGERSSLRSEIVKKLGGQLRSQKITSQISLPRLGKQIDSASSAFGSDQEALISYGLAASLRVTRPEGRR